MEDKIIRIGIIGTGFTVGIANSHFRAYNANPHTKIVGCYDKVPGRAQMFLDKGGYEGVTVYDSVERLLSQVDAVSLCVPNSEHVPLALKALKAGKHVLVEKPFALNVKEAEEAVKEAKKRPELVAMNCFNFREQPANMFIKEIVESGVLGPIRFVRLLYGGGRINNPEGVFLEWRMQSDKSGTGSMGDFGAHVLDSVDWIFSEQCGKFVSYSAQTTTNIRERYVIDPSSVKGDKLGDQKAPVTNDDTAQISAITESGMMFSLMTSRMNYLGNHYEVVGENGCISSGPRYGDSAIGMMLKNAPVPGQTEIKPGMQIVQIPQRIIDAGDLSVGHHGVVAEFADCILNGRKPERSFERGLYIQKQLDSFRKAAESGRIITVDPAKM